MAPSMHDQAEQAEPAVARHLAEQQAEEEAGAEADALHDERTPPGRPWPTRRPRAAGGGSARPAGGGRGPEIISPSEPASGRSSRVTSGSFRRVVNSSRTTGSVSSSASTASASTCGGSDGVGDERGADGGDGEAQGEQHRIHQMSIFTMRMIIPIPTPTETAAPMRAKRPAAVQHRVEVARAHRLDGEEQADGQAAQHPGRHAALGGEDLDLPADLLPAPHELGQREEQVGQLAADRLLDADGLDHPGQVLDVEPLRHALQGVDQRVTQGGLGHHPLELLRQRRLALLDHRLHRPQGGVAGLEGGGDEATAPRAAGPRTPCGGGRP